MYLYRYANIYSVHESAINAFLTYRSFPSIKVHYSANASIKICVNIAMYSSV